MNHLSTTKCFLLCWSLCLLQLQTTADLPSVNFGPDVSFSEGEGTVSVNLTVDKLFTVENPLSVTVITVPGSATAADYNFTSPLTVQFQNSLTVQVEFTIVSDTLKEPRESFLLGLLGDRTVFKSTKGTITITIIDDDSSGTFDCRRRGQNLCQNNASCDSQGVCQCPAKYEGYKCDIDKSTVNSGNCNPACVSGQCAADGATSRCYCDAEHLDEGVCDTVRYKAKCDSAAMSINIVPIGSFQGLIYVNGHDSTCLFQDVGTLTGLPADYTSGLARVIPHTDTNCGNAVSKSGNGKIHRSRIIYVQYHPDYTSAVDEVVEGLCTYDTSQTVTFENVFNSVLPATTGGNGQQGAIRVTAGGDLNPLKLKILKDGQEVTTSTPIRIGTMLTLELNVYPATDFEDFVIESLTIDNNKQGANQKSLPVITNRCHVGGDITGIIPEPVRDQNSFRTVFTFMTIKFSKSDDLRIIFEAKMCLKGDTTGCTAVCNQRRRRAIESRDTKTIEVVMKIWDYTDNTEDNKNTDQQPDGSQNEAAQSSNLFGMSDGILAGVIVLSVVIVIVIVAVVVFTYRVLRKKREMKEPENYY
ncbi:uncharacterized protein LOC121376918 [Gigantopelta aegis]|uniref:uncharacterized protein LOC121376918 n=1 Tax=Gigantopelta aegis TaxID=1735272 RepID=UPI001B88D122|nr:uncharacterized protein LOC121376918 [Gigantopelta aegis]